MNKEAVREYLIACRGRRTEVCRQAGVGYEWAVKFMQGKIKNPGTDQISALSKLMRQEARQQRRKTSQHTKAMEAQQ